MNYAPDMRTIKTFLLCFGLVCIAAIAGRVLMADASGPSAEDYADLKVIQQNQEIIAETREAYNRFMAAKEDNEARVKALNGRGWNVDWHSMSLVQASF